jgi:HD superfamily phosphodiesterase
MELEKELPKIELIARQFYARLDFAHDESHGERVVASAELLQAKEGGEKALVLAGAWLHQFHDNLHELDMALAGLALSDVSRSCLHNLVEFCRPLKISTQAALEARIVFDADALDLVGPYGTVRELLCNFQHRRQTWKDAVENCQRVQKLFVDKLQTPTARELAHDAINANAKFWDVYRQELERSSGSGARRY